MNVALELQRKELHVDLYLKALDKNGKLNRTNMKDLKSIAFTKQGFPVHKLILASVSPFFKNMFQDHYSDHKESCLTILLPETSSLILFYIIVFIYTNHIDIPHHHIPDVLLLAKTLQISTLVSKLDPSTTICSFKEIKSPVNKKRARQNLQANSSITSNDLLITQRQRIIKSKYDSNIFEFQPLSLGRKKFVDHMQPKEIEKKIIHSSQTNVKINSDKDKAVGNSYIKISDTQSQESLKTSNTKYWLNPTSSDLSKNVLYVNSDHSKSDIVLFANSQSIFNSRSSVSNPPSVLFPVSSNSVQSVEGTISKSVSGLTLIGMPPVLSPNETFTVSSYTPSSTPSSPILSLNNPKESVIQDSKECREPISFESDAPMNNFEESEVGLELTPNQEEEEEKLKLQVLLKECEEMDLGGRAFSDPPPQSSTLPNLSKTSSVSAPLTPLTSEDFSEKINQWIHHEPGKNLKESSHDNWSSKSSENIDVPCGNLDSRSVERKESENHSLMLSIHDQKDSESTKNNGKGKRSACEKNEFASSTNSASFSHKGGGVKPLLQCKICGKMLKAYSRFDLKLHEARHGQATLPCSICQKAFKLKRDLNAHMKTHTNERPFKCDRCDKSLSTRRNLNMHISMIHEKLKPYSCNICLKNYSKRSSLQVHIRSVHTGEKPYKCLQCPKRFASSSLLSAHRAVHSLNYRYTCAICKKGFKCFTNLFSHKKIHLKEKSFSCVECKAQFQSQLMLLKHKLTHKRFSQPMTCRYCDQIFEMKEAYELHMLRVHKEKVKIAEVNVNKIKLPITSKVYGRMSTSNKVCPNNYLNSSSILKAPLTEKHSHPKLEPIKLFNLPVKLSDIPFNLLSECKTPRSNHNSKSLNNQSISNSSINPNLVMRPTIISTFKTSPQVGSNNSNRLHHSGDSSSKISSEKKTDILQVSDVNLADLPARFQFSKDSSKVLPSENLGSNSVNESEKDAHLKCGSSSFKLVEHINNFSCNLQTVSLDGSSCDKSESSFIDTFSKSSDDDNVDKFLFEEISSFVN